MSNDSNNAFGDNPTEPFGPGDGPASMLGRYRLLRELGRGGFGTVWLAEERGQVTRRVAIKILTDPLSSREVLARFQQEIQAQAMMNHPGIAKVLAADRAPDGRPYYVMEYIKGLPITTFCDQKELSIKDRLVLFRRVCDAVQHAHMKGVIHRDIKPSNVMAGLVEDAERFESIEQVFVRVIDFGVAKAINRPLIDATIATADFQMIGTAGYMSPEQASPDAMGIDTRADVYSLGVMLYELLVGARPFTNDQLKNAMWKGIHKFLQETEPPPPSTRLSNLRTASDDEGQNSATIARARGCALDVLVEELRRELEWIPLHAMAKLPEDRYRSPADLADDIARYLEGKPLRAGPRTLWYHARKIARLYRPQVAVAFTILTLLITGAAAVTWQWREAESARARAVEQKTEVEWNAYRGFLFAAAARAREQDHARAEELLRSTAPLLRGWEYNFLNALIGDRANRQTSLDRVLALFPTTDPNRRDVVGRMQDATLTRDARGWRISNFRFREIAINSLPSQTIATSADGSRVLCSNGAGGLAVLSRLPNQTKLLATLERPSGSPALSGGSLSPDGSLVAAWGEGSVDLFDATTGALMKQLGEGDCARFLADASLLIAGPTLRRYADRGVGSIVSEAAISLQGKRRAIAASTTLALVRAEGGAELIELESGRSRWVIEGQFTTGAVFTEPNVAVLGERSLLRVVSAENPSMTADVSVPLAIDNVGEGPSPGNMWISTKAIGTLEFETLPTPTPRARPAVDARAMIPAPVGRDVIVISDAGATVMEIATGRTRTELGSVIATPAWSPDAAHIIAIRIQNGVQLIEHRGSNEPNPIPLPDSAADHIARFGSVAMAYSPNADRVLLVWGEDTHYAAAEWSRVQSSWSATRRWPLEANQIDDAKSSARAVVAAWDPAGSRRAIGFLTRVIYWDDTASPVVVETTIQPTHMRFSPDSRFIGIAGAPLMAGTINLETGTLAELGADARRMTDDRTLGLAWTAAPQRLIHLRSRGLTVWDGTRELFDLTHDPVAASALLADSTSIEVARDGRIGPLTDLIK